MEYSILFLPLIGAIFGYLAKYFGDLTSQLLTTFFVCVSAILSIVLFTMESFTELTVTI